MTVRDTVARRRGRVLHVVGSPGGPRPGRAWPGRRGLTSQWRGPAGPPRREDDRR
ncbi:hypothetical protein [Micromonospora sp. NPDC002575]|uniref:hypothetical protein n=1 Tax=Micromonospora sp. NPDC002575 TaxID=3364222 RepID=UPI0036765807